MVKTLGSNTHYVENKIEEDLGLILQKFIVQFYTTQNIPKQIIVSHNILEKKLLENAFFTKTKSTIEILLATQNL